MGRGAEDMPPQGFTKAKLLPAALGDYRVDAMGGFIDHAEGAIRQALAHIFRGLAKESQFIICLLYTSDAADELLCVDLGGTRLIKKKKQTQNT